MYVSDSAPLPRNSMDAPSAQQVARRRARVDRLNLAAALARKTVECPPDPWAFVSMGTNLALDVKQANEQAANSWNNPQVSGAPLAGGSIPGNTLADPPAGGPAQVVRQYNRADVSRLVAMAPQVVPIALSPAQVNECSIAIPLPSQQPRPQVTVRTIMPQPAPPLPVPQRQPGSVQPLTAVAQDQRSQAQIFQDYCNSLKGTPWAALHPRCGGVMSSSAPPSGGPAPKAPGFANAYASIVNTSRGVGDLPPWGNAFIPPKNGTSGGGISASKVPMWGIIAFLGVGLAALAHRQ